MARQALTPERILETIEELDAGGLDVTVTAVRERLGTGSYTTIGAVLNEWRRQRKAPDAAAVPEAPASLRPLAQRIWSEAWKAAQAALQVERLAFTQERAALAREKEEMAAEISRLEREAAKQADAKERALQSAEDGTAGLKAAELECAKVRQENELLRAEADRLRLEAQKATDAVAGWIERATRAEARLEETHRRAAGG